MKDKPLPLWTYEGNDGNISEWLDAWLKDTDASTVDLLTRAWLNGVANPDSDWTRDRELLEWIEASKMHRHAWEGMKRLLQELRKRGQPLPAQLLIWALDVADGTRQPPIRSRGRDGEALRLRNLRIVMAVEALRYGSLPATSSTGQSACGLVAEKVGLSFEAVCTIWRDGKDKWLENYFHLDRGFKLDEGIRRIEGRYLITGVRRAAGEAGQPGEGLQAPLFQSIDPAGRRLTERALSRRLVLAMINRRATAAGLPPTTCCHTFRATGTTSYLSNGGTLEHAQRIAAHAPPKTTTLYDRTADTITIDEIERIVI